MIYIYTYIATQNTPVLSTVQNGHPLIAALQTFTILYLWIRNKYFKLITCGAAVPTRNTCNRGSVKSRHDCAGLREGENTTVFVPKDLHSGRCSSSSQWLCNCHPLHLLFWFLWWPVSRLLRWRAPSHLVNHLFELAAGHTSIMCCISWDIFLQCNSTGKYSIISTAIFMFTVFVQ